VSREIAREELRDRIDDITLVEALPRPAFRRLHLPSAVNIPKSEVAALAPELLPSFDAEIVVYCGSWLCRSSDRVADKLRRLGYTNVRVYRGGKLDWRRAGLPTVRSNA
jgi:rhodanese-related sulfurtransferase